MIEHTSVPEVRRRSQSRDRWRERGLVLARDPAGALTVALGFPAVAAALVAGRFDAAAIAFAAAAIAGAAQVIVRVISRAVRYRQRRVLTMIRLVVAIFLAAALSQLVIPASFALYIPVVGLAAALGVREGLTIGAVAVGLYVVPVVVGPGPVDPELLSRGTAGATVCVLVAGGARFFVGRLESASADLRRTRDRERRRVRQIAGIEKVGRLLAVGPTTDALGRVMDVLVEQFGFRYV